MNEWMTRFVNDKASIHKFKIVLKYYFIGTLGKN